MSDHPPYADPVQFDQGKAQAAIDALNAALSKLRNDQQVRWPKGNAMLVTWTGPYADQYRGELQRMLSDSGNICQAIEGQITTISNAIEEAKRRQRANQAWHDEQNQQQDPGVVPGL